MSRFLILFNAPEPMSEFMSHFTPDERQADLDAWTEWKREAEKSITFQIRRRRSRRSEDSAKRFNR